MKILEHAFLETQHRGPRPDCHHSGEKSGMTTIRKCVPLASKDTTIMRSVPLRLSEGTKQTSNMVGMKGEDRKLL